MGLQTIAVSLNALLSGMVDAGLSLEALCTYLDLTRETLFAHVVRLDLPTPPDTARESPRQGAGWSRTSGC